VKSWFGAGKRGAVAADDVAAAIASITGTMTKRMPVPQQSNVKVTIRMGVQNDAKAELDDIIERLTTLRDSLS
jgi:hypothetical protein